LLRSNTLSLDVTYPVSTSSIKPFTLKAKHDTTVEEVIDFALWTYCDEGLLPNLEEEMARTNDQKRKNKLSAVRWSLRIAKGSEMDDDFPSTSILSFRPRPFTGYLSTSIAQPRSMYVAIWLITHARQAVLIRCIAHIALQTPAQV
jgi:hypothetical protein